MAPRNRSGITTGSLHRNHSNSWVACAPPHYGALKLHRICLLPASELPVMGRFKTTYPTPNGWERKQEIFPTAFEDMLLTWRVCMLSMPCCTKNTKKTAVCSDIMFVYHHFLPVVGGFNFDPFEKYACQNGNLPYI